MNKDQILHWLAHNKRKWISVLVILLIFIIITPIAVYESRKVDPFHGARESYTTATNDKALYSLINTYYESYGTNNIEELELVAYPISEMERSYIEFLSDYTEKYEIVDIYKKPGYSEGEYLVSVKINVKFKDHDAISPGLDFFYVMTDMYGNLYIDNKYCAFNEIYAEEDPDPDIISLKERFESQEDVVMLRLNIQTTYNALLDEDEDFAAFVYDELPMAIRGWYDGYFEAIAMAEAEIEAARLAEEEAARIAEEARLEEERKAAEEAQKAAEEEERRKKEEEEFKNSVVVRVKEKVNIRAAASIDSEIVGTAEAGVQVRKYTEEGEWSKIDFGDIKAYIRSDFLE